MEGKKYHHGDLKNALIEAGIDLINQSGQEGLSLRKTAALCGVSPAAPYAHFENKAALLAAIEDHVTKNILEALRDAVSDGRGSAYEIMLRLGEAYIKFFMAHPSYFKLMCFSENARFPVSAEDDPEAYPPYRLFRACVQDCLLEMRVPEKRMLYCLTHIWASVQGLALLASQSNVQYAGDWEQDLRMILTNGKGRILY